MRFLSSSGYYEPRRSQPEDCNVVLNIPYFTAKYDCHINFEWSASVNLFQYLFKYFYKGPDHTNWAVVKTNETPTSDHKRQPVDQIKDYERGHYLSSIESAMGLASYHITAKFPGVKRLPIHLPGRHHGQFKRRNHSESDATLLIRYLDRPIHPQLDDLTYSDFGAKCRLIPHDQTKNMHPLEILENENEGRPRMRIHFFAEKHQGVSRIQMVYPRHGDVFYLRALLLHRSAHSWKELKTVDGVLHPTFQSAAQNFGLFQNSNEATIAFEELLHLGSPPSQLRWLFAVLAAEGEIVCNLWNSYQAELSADIRDFYLRSSPTPDPQLIKNQLLISLQDLLRGLGKKLGDIGLPDPVEDQDSEVDAEQVRWGGDHENLSSFRDSLTPEQVCFYPLLLLIPH
jgi:hypothetical protein